MSQTPQTPATSKSSSSASTSKQAKEINTTNVFPNQAPPAVVGKGERVARDFDVKQFSTNSTTNDERLKLTGEMMWLNDNVEVCKQSGIEWLEASDDLIKHLCKGELPAEGYLIYKNIRVCQVGKAEEIARKEQMTCHEILFAGEAGKMQVR